MSHTITSSPGARKPVSGKGPVSAAMTLCLDIICENTVGRPIAACGEHGFSCLVRTACGTLLFDTGSGATLLNNLETLGHDASLIDGVVLSHGHYDHSGGLLSLLRKVGPRPVYAHPHIFSQRFWQGQYEQRNISLPYSRGELEAAGASFHFLDHLTELCPGLFFSGRIPRSVTWEEGDPHLVRRSTDEAGWKADAFPDDAALAVQTAKGLVVLLGCAHAGMVNTLEHFRKQLGYPRIHLILGGTHLGPASDHQFSETVEYLMNLDFDRLGVAHCTGQLRAAQLHAKFPNKVFFANVGTTLTIA
jgi:7,8-dihydropterin-6-yl-methyl-4-(beta-D-ribofuranosyl)aminobenzene 5'-phosphate synthase